jgi:hypothetical protein
MLLGSDTILPFVRPNSYHPKGGTGLTRPRGRSLRASSSFPSARIGGGCRAWRTIPAFPGEPPGRAAGGGPRRAAVSLLRSGRSVRAEACFARDDPAESPPTRWRRVGCVEGSGRRHRPRTRAAWGGSSSQGVPRSSVRSERVGPPRCVHTTRVRRNALRRVPPPGPGHRRRRRGPPWRRAAAARGAPPTRGSSRLGAGNWEPGAWSPGRRPVVNACSTRSRVRSPRTVSR